MREMNQVIPAFLWALKDAASSRLLSCHTGHPVCEPCESCESRLCTKQGAGGLEAR